MKAHRSPINLQDQFFVRVIGLEPIYLRGQYVNLKGTVLQTADVTLPCVYFVVPTGLEPASDRVKICNPILLEDSTIF